MFVFVPITQLKFMQKALGYLPSLPHATLLFIYFHSITPPPSNSSVVTMKAFLFLSLSTLIAIIGGAPTLGPYIRFLKRLLFGPSDLKYSNAIIFDENHGEVNRGHFENAYGHQGHILIAAYGLGLPPQKLKALGYL